MILAHKIQLDPTPAQVDYFRRACGTARFTWIKSDLTLKDRVYVCSACGVEIDRDLNAALNLRTLGYRGSHACGHIDARGQVVEAGTHSEPLATVVS